METCTRVVLFSNAAGGETDMSRREVSVQRLCKDYVFQKQNKKSEVLNSPGIAFSLGHGDWVLCCYTEQELTESKNQAILNSEDYESRACLSCDYKILFYAFSKKDFLECMYNITYQ